ncbi:MAG: guanylate kinase [Dehalococcoidales bacterium]|nr:guanylate kinase [Dehalococcoidales bacterium]
MTVTMSREDRPESSVPAPLLIILSGLSGVGKDAVLRGLRESGPPLEFIVTLTTRPPRTGEQDGVHYRFVSSEKFLEMRDAGQLLEWASVYGNYYGPPREPVKQALEAGKDVIVKVDVQGVATIKKNAPECVAIFLATPTMEELERRLRNRHTETPEDLALRLKTAAGELKQVPLFDYIVLNREGELDRAVEDIRAIITAEKCRVQPRNLPL